jgi:hypothetical protein
MATKSDIQYTVRNVPASVDKAIRAKARRLGCSVNDVLLESLRSEMGVEKQYHDLDRFFGSWVEDAEIDAALRAQRQIDKAMWR